MKEKHSKHPVISRPTRGKYNRIEFAIYGTSCAQIEAFYQAINQKIKDRYHCIYVDGVHDAEQQKSAIQHGVKQFSMSPDTIWNEYDDKINFADADIVFVNGNHYPAAQQIVFVNPNKKDSLHKRIDQLSDICMIINTDSNQEIYHFLEDKVSDNTTYFHMDDIDKIVDQITTKIRSSSPAIKALILAGGKSSRMNEDKSELHYSSQKSQQIHVADICHSLGLEVHISKSHTFQYEKIEDYPVIKDRLVEMGPFGAIMSAMMYDSNSAWMVLACDLPLLKKDNLEQLINERDSTKLATTFIGKDNPFPEPLITIYEPRAYKRFLDFMSLGYACPRKVLINSGVKKIPLIKNDVIRNANTQEERKEIEKMLKN